MGHFYHFDNCPEWRTLRKRPLLATSLSELPKSTRFILPKFSPFPWGFFASWLFGWHQITAFTQPKKAGQSDKRRTPRHYRAQLMEARHRPLRPDPRGAHRRAVPEAGRPRQESPVLPRRSPDGRG